MDYEAQYDKLYRYCYFKLGHRQLAEDVTQEAFLRYLDSGRQGGEAYLYVTARNLCIDHWRKKGTEPLQDELSQPGPEDAIILRTELQRALDQLPEEDRELILLRCVNEVPVGVAARLMGISRFAVYRRTERSLRQLREFLGKENWE